MSNKSIEISGLVGEEVGQVEGMINGFNWVRVEKGRIISIPTTNPLPAPTDDPEMLPFWRPYNPEEPNTPRAILQFTDHEGFKHQFCASITISSLCGHYYTPERYKEEAARLESYGFECMRSRRSENGQYWELWFLPGLWCARGELRQFVALCGSAKTDDLCKDFRRQLKIILDFLGTHVSFGSLDVTVQRLAMPAPD